jgi:hypothetical protein
MSENMDRILISHSLNIKLKKYLKNSTFLSVDEFASSILEEYVAHMEKSEDDKSDDDEKLILDRLKKLGYIA